MGLTERVVAGVEELARNSSNFHKNPYFYLEFFFLGLIMYVLARRQYKPKEKPKLSEEQIQTAVDSWKPGPLVPEGSVWLDTAWLQILVSMGILAYTTASTQTLGCTTSEYATRQEHLREGSPLCRRRCTPAPPHAPQAPPGGKKLPRTVAPSPHFLALPGGCLLAVAAPASPRLLASSGKWAAPHCRRCLQRRRIIVSQWQQ